MIDLGSIYNIWLGVLVNFDKVMWYMYDNNNKKGKYMLMC